MQSKWLACSSNKNTIHVYQIPEKHNPKEGIELQDEEENEDLIKDLSASKKQKN